MFSIARSSHSRRAWVPRYLVPRRYGAVLRMDWQDPAVSETGGHDQRLVILELSEAGLGIGVDKGLPIDPANPFQRAHLEGVSRAAKAKTFGFELASLSRQSEL